MKIPHEDFIIADFEIDYVVNFDETCVLYINSPNKLWLPVGTANYKVAKKANTYKKVTVCLACTAIGSKLEPQIIFTLMRMERFIRKNVKLIIKILIA